VSERYPSDLCLQFTYAETDRMLARAEEAEKKVAQLTAELEAARAERDAAEVLLADVAYQIVSVGGIDNHGHRREATACTECKLVNRLIEHVADGVDAAFRPPLDPAQGKGGER
jgi:hypothetical protein